MDKSPNKMSSPATLGGESSPWQGSAGEDDLVHEESMLKRKLAILEEFMDIESGAPLEDRCQILRQKIGSLEADIFRSGRTDASHQYLKEAPGPAFVDVKPEEFTNWLSISERRASDQFNRAEKDLATLLNGRTQFFGSGNALHVFPVTPDVSPHSEDNENFTERPHKRPRIAEKDKPPCLRCRILKKKCDSLEQCSHCPTQSLENESDFWKVLGCFRSQLQDLSLIFCPAFARSTTRTFRYRNGSREVVNFVLAKSRVSDQKRRRMMHLVEARPDFAQLDDTAWDDISNRESVSEAASCEAAMTSSEYGGEGDTFTPEGFLQQDYEAAWSVLQAVSMDPTYLTKTEYNLFTLLRQGNEFSVYEPEYWELFNQTKRILRQSVEYYLLEGLCSRMAFGDMAPPFDPSSSTPNTLVLVDLKEDMENFLRRFEKNCAGRAKLTGFAQLACFYALLVFGVAKSILIDAYSIRSEYEDPNPWDEEDAIRIVSAYKALVSVFCWSSKSDVVRDAEIDQDDELGIALLETRAMVHSAKWDERGFRGMKEFLLGLGSCFFADGTYNGFFMQKFGRERLPTTFSKGVLAVKGSSERLICQTKPSVSERILQEERTGEIKRLAPTVHLFSVAQEQDHFHRFDLSIPRDPVGFFSSPPPNQFQDPTPVSVFNAHKPSKCGNESTFTFVGHDENNGHTGVRGQSRRKGALDAETLRKAREVRKLGACWNCWVMKIPCSEGTTCDRCRKKSSTPVYRLCNRNPFTAYGDLLFPDFLISDFSAQALQRFTDDNIRGFTNQILNVVVTWGEGTLKLRASPFVTVPNSMMQKTYHSQDGHPLGVESLPVGLTEANMVLMEQACLEELEHKLANQTFISGIVCWRTSAVSKSILETVFRYYHTMPVKHPLIHTILQLRLAIRAISNPPIFTDSSAKMILYHTQTKYPSVEFYSSRLLNRQLKHVTIKICCDLTYKFLSKLEKAVRSRDKSFWPIYFASMILLCSTIEHDQILLNAHVQTARAARPDTVIGMDGEPQKSCLDLEEGPYAQLTHLFHALFRTGKRDSGGLNPFRDEFELNTEKHFDAASMTMIREIKKKFFEEVELLRERDKPLVHDLKPEDFAKRNSGRLVSKFLLSFMPLNEVR